MGLDINKYCKSAKKKRTFWQTFKIKWYNYKKQINRSYRNWKNEENSVINTIIAFIIVAIIGFVPVYIEAHKETILGILWAILYCLCWLIGIILTIFISKVSVCFLYRTSVSLAAKFVADVWEEVELKRERRKKEINDN